MTRIVRVLLDINFGGSKKNQSLHSFSYKGKSKVAKKQLWPLFTSQTWRPFQKGPARFKAKSHFLTSKFKEQRSVFGTLTSPICFFRRQSYCKLASKLLKLPTWMETEHFTEGHVKLLEPSISGPLALQVGFCCFTSLLRFFLQVLQPPFPPVKQNSKFYFDQETVDNKSHHVDCPLPNSHCY